MNDFKVGDIAFISLGWLGCPSDIVKCRVLSDLNTHGQHNIITLESCSLGEAGYGTSSEPKYLLKYRSKEEEQIAEFKEFQKAVDWFGQAMNGEGLTLGVGRGYAVKDKNDKTLGAGNDPSNAIFHAYKNRNK